MRIRGLLLLWSVGAAYSYSLLPCTPSTLLNSGYRSTNMFPSRLLGCKLLRKMGGLRGAEVGRVVCCAPGASPSDTTCDPAAVLVGLLFSAFHFFCSPCRPL